MAILISANSKAFCTNHDERRAQYSMYRYEVPDLTKLERGLNTFFRCLVGCTPVPSSKNVDFFWPNGNAFILLQSKWDYHREYRNTSLTESKKALRFSS